MIIKKGNVLVSNKNQHILCETIIADVEVLLTHSTTIKVGYHPIMHTLNVRTSAVIEEITDKVSARSNFTDDDLILRTADRARIKFDYLLVKDLLKKVQVYYYVKGVLKLL